MMIADTRKRFLFVLLVGLCCEKIDKWTESFDVRKVFLELKSESFANAMVTASFRTSCWQQRKSNFCGNKRFTGVC